MIELEHVVKVFGQNETSVRAIDDLSFCCPAGAFWAIMGPSGSGRARFFINRGLTRPSSGRILVEGGDVAAMTPAGQRHCAGARSATSESVNRAIPDRKNVGMPLVLDGVSHAEINSRVAEALDLVGVSHRAAHHPAHLSGGEQQRVAIARALVIRPAIVLADEPTGNLDRASGRTIIDLLQDINERTGVTILLVTHDPVFAAHAQRVLRLVDGNLQQDLDVRDAPRVQALQS
jgi:putative ABC transport system ATP-binding protein